MAQRSELKQYLDCRLRFSGIVSRFRQTTSSRIRGTIKTVMLKDIRMAGQIDILTDHVWIRHGRWARHLEKGDVIPFLKIYIALAVLMKYQTPVIPATGVRLMTLSLKVAT